MYVDYAQPRWKLFLYTLQDRHLQWVSTWEIRRAVEKHFSGQKVNKLLIELCKTMRRKNQALRLILFFFSLIIQKCVLGSFTYTTSRSLFYFVLVILLSLDFGKPLLVFMTLEDGFFSRNI